MNALGRVVTCLLAGGLLAITLPPRGFARHNRDAALYIPQPSGPDRDGQHDFDFEIGTWAMQRRRLAHPLTSSTSWVDPGPATHIVRAVWGGRASLGELRVDAPTPHFVGSILHLYDPQSHQWYLYWASAEDGKVAAPMVGGFKNGRGEFIDQEPFDGRMILARLVYSDITPTSFRTEQSFSADGGATWEPNAIDTYTRQALVH